VRCSPTRFSPAVGVIHRHTASIALGVARTTHRAHESNIRPVWVVCRTRRVGYRHRMRDGVSLPGVPSAEGVSWLAHRRVRTSAARPATTVLTITALPGVRPAPVHVAARHRVTSATVSSDHRRPAPRRLTRQACGVTSNRSGARTPFGPRVNRHRDRGRDPAGHRTRGSPARRHGAAASGPPGVGRPARGCSCV
jgi:hypothetical protein